MSFVQRNVIPVFVSVLAILVLYYVTIPAANIHSLAFWWFLVCCMAIIFAAFGLPRLGEAGMEFIDDIRRGGIGAFKGYRTRNAGHKKSPVLIPLVAAFVLIFGMVVGSIASSTFFNARAYSQLLTVEDGDFATDIAEISVDTVPVVDRSSAIRLGSRTIGEMSDLVSQFVIDESSNAYTQISYNGTAYRVSSLKYADIIKWFTNTGAGLPGYVTVNMVTQETELVRLEEGNYMRYSTAEHFNRYLYRYVRFAYPTEIFGEAAFEIDDDGVPYWIVPTVNMRIGLFGGEDYDGMILVNACTGEMIKYELGEIPSWVDKVFTADMLYNQLSYYGKFQSGFWNSMIGQSGVLVPSGTTLASFFTDDDSGTTTSALGWSYNYLAIGDDVWMYTGMTSANSDESLVGFVLVNLQTKETKYYTCAGATESSAMSSAEGQVQQMSYEATAPLLLNIADRPTYFLSLKDDAGLVKMYAFIDVQQYQIVGTGSSIDEAQTAYIKALGADDQVDLTEEDLAAAVETFEGGGWIDQITSAVVEGNTTYYFTLEHDASLYAAAISVNARLAFAQAGDKVSFTYTEAESYNEVTALELLD